MESMEELQQLESQRESIFNIGIIGFQEVQKAGLSLDTLFLLECYNEGTDVTKHIHSSKLLAWRQTLIRKGYLREDNIVTSLGKLLLTTSKEGLSFSSIEKTKKAMVGTEFDRWWRSYPATDVFEHEGKAFQGTRSLKSKREECKKKFYQIVNEGVYTSEDLIKALETEVLIKKDASVRERENKLKYMSNSLTYLNNRGFESFIELSKTYKSKNNIINNTTDI